MKIPIELMKKVINMVEVNNLRPGDNGYIPLPIKQLADTPISSVPTNAPLGNYRITVEYWSSNELAVNIPDELIEDWF